MEKITNVILLEADDSSYEETKRALLKWQPALLITRAKTLRLFRKRSRWASFDLALAGYRTPNQEGPELAQYLHSHHPALPLVFVISSAHVYGDADTKMFRNATACINANALDQQLYILNKILHQSEASAHQRARVGLRSLEKTRRISKAIGLIQDGNKDNNLSQAIQLLRSVIGEHDSDKGMRSYVGEVLAVESMITALEETIR